MEDKDMQTGHDRIEADLGNLLHALSLPALTFVCRQILHGCAFQSKADTNSNAKRTVIPIQSGHLFQSKADRISNL